MHSLDCDDFLSQDSPGAWVLAILCDFKDRLPEQVVHAILTRLKERLGDNLPRLREYVYMLDVLAANRDLNPKIREDLDMFTVDIEKLATISNGLGKRHGEGTGEGNNTRLAYA